MSEIETERQPFTVMAVASGGGHWEELMLLRPAFDAFGPVYATTNASLARRENIARIHVLPDANRDQFGQSIRCLRACVSLVRRVRPDLLISTGALPGLFCLIAARLTGARTIWIDSVANSDAPSLSGRLARPFASLWLTQWAHLATERTILYRGGLL